MSDFLKLFLSLFIATELLRKYGLQCGMHIAVLEVPKLHRCVWRPRCNIVIVTSDYYAIYILSMLF